MRKEIVFAILAGGALGLIIAFGVWRANSAFKPAGSGSTENSSTPPPSANLAIAIAKPEDNEIVTENTVTVSGITKPSSWIAISGESKDYVVAAGPDGTFSIDVDLTPGLNQIIVVSFDPSYTASTAKINVVYSSEFVKTAATSSPAPEATASSSSEAAVRAKVEAKIEEARKVARAYIGSVTDISEKTLQIKSGAGQILQAEAPDGVTVVKIGKDNAVKSVKFTDIAIGDFILTLGYKNSNNVLETTRVLIVPPIGPTARKALVGTVVDTGTNALTISAFGAKQETSVLISKTARITRIVNDKTNTLRFGDLSEQDVVLVVGNPDDKNPSTFLARRINVITPKVVK